MLSAFVELLLSVPLMSLTLIRLEQHNEATALQPIRSSARIDRSTNTLLRAIKGMIASVYFPVLDLSWIKQQDSERLRSGAEARRGPNGPGLVPVNLVVGAVGG
jgi:hypothetical protein